MNNVVMSGTGLFTPPHSVSNEELVQSFNQYVDQANKRHPENPLQYSSAEFIEKASGVKRRYFMDKTGVLDPERLKPILPTKTDDEPSIMCEMAVNAAKEALLNSQKSAKDIDLIIVACSNMPRGYPALAIEVQAQLGCAGAAYDMNVACASAAFGLHSAYAAIKSGTANCVLMVNPEITSAHVNFRDRDSHFIFGDACTAVILENEQSCQLAHPYKILDTKVLTQFSNHIRNNFGFLNHCEKSPREDNDKFFNQQGRKVFREVTPVVVNLIQSQLNDLKISTGDVGRYWMHQANANMNRVILEKLLGKEIPEDKAPIILDEYANTSSAGAVIAFHKYHEDLSPGTIGLLCAFGGGYSVGSIVFEKC